jgi:hypothetical protein
VRHLLRLTLCQLAPSRPTSRQPALTAVVRAVSGRPQDLYRRLGHEALGPSRTERGRTRGE